MSMIVRVITLLVVVAFSSVGKAELYFKADEGEDGLRFVIVAGTFSIDDDLADFESVIRAHRPKIVGFDSEGGSIFKAMELGRMIRQHGLATVQLRELECASACALAFMGGRSRYAAPGSIGVHKSSFAPTTPFNKEEAVSAVQDVTADIIGYMVEMGVDPALLQLAFKTEADDIRYLSGREMADFGVTLSEGRTDTGVISRPSGQVAPGFSSPAPQVSTDPKVFAPSRTSIPVARSGRVRHPKGSVLMKAAPDAKAQSIRRLSNGAAVQIIGEKDRWYSVSVSGVTGYMHHTWIRVDQFDATPGQLRLIQIKSFDNIEDAVGYATARDLPLSVYLATNGWYAVTIAKPFDKKQALYFAKGLKREGAIPQDSFVTLGNTYVMKICCGTDTSYARASGYSQ
ncbi:SH3 domain-containing protein [Labrenzia sp. 011]|uniref:SH3 domain-containing protein n=1 Tax=Labrenzia sp. 011 TaxID=2171494 RepID=UPI001403E436|nr:SH3 domain-containing protein [Labrenzia sp. 011]